MTDYQLTLTKHMYLQQLLSEAFPIGAPHHPESEEEQSRTVTIVIVSDNHRSPVAPRSATTTTSSKTKFVIGKSRRPTVVKRRRSSKSTSATKGRRRRSSQFQQTLAKLEQSRWQSILFSKVAEPAVEAPPTVAPSTTTTASSFPKSAQSLEKITAAKSTAAPRRPNRRGSIMTMGAAPRFPRRQASIVQQATAASCLDDMDAGGSNHSQVAANAA